MTPRNLTTAEAADRADVSPRMIRHYVKTLRIEPVERVGKIMFFSPADVDELAARIERRNRVGVAA